MVNQLSQMTLPQLILVAGIGVAFFFLGIALFFAMLALLSEDSDA